MPLYSKEKLISQTRHLAAEYRRTTGQTLPVSAEIARHDAMNALGLLLPEGEAVAGVDLIGGESWHTGEQFQVKGRVIFDDAKSGHRIGQMNPSGLWDGLLLVIMNADYESCEIYHCSKAVLLAETEPAKESSRAKRGALSVAKFKIIGDLVWTREQGIVLPVAPC